MWSGKGEANGCNRPKGIFEDMGRSIVLMLIMLRVDMNILLVVVMVVVVVVFESPKAQNPMMFTVFLPDF